MELNDLYPPRLDSLLPIMNVIPSHLFPWIAEKHVKYLDDRIHKIVKLTDYLANCTQVKNEREDFIFFIESWTQKENIDLIQYLKEYQQKYATIRATIENQCHRILYDAAIWESKTNIVEFWKEFSFYNEIDSLFGMFLTSGRWYVNAMLPVVKVFVYSILPKQIVGEQRNVIAYQVAKRTITPRYFNPPTDYDSSYEKQFAKMFIPLLQYYDRKLLFLFDSLSNYHYFHSMTLNDFVAELTTNKHRYYDLLENGIFPPFAWHELIASQKPRKESLNFEKAIQKLSENVGVVNRDSFDLALLSLEILKKYELDYNNYNYKGKFGLISKYFYFQTYQRINNDKKEFFLNAILLDEFFNALEIVINNIE